MELASSAGVRRPGTDAARRLERQHRKDATGFPDALAVEQLFLATVQVAQEAGYAQYEASSFAWAGHESVHNSAYWRGFDYIGLGPGAHGRFFLAASGGRRQRRVQILQPEAWAANIERGGNGCARLPRRVASALPLLARLSRSQN